jgi:hypothetical protein
LQDNFGSEIIIPVNLTIDTYMDGNETAIDPGNIIVLNHPNPFRDNTIINTSVSGHSATRMDIFNLQGYVVRSVDFNAGHNRDIHFEWNGNDNSDNPLPAGIYFIRIVSGDHHGYARLVKIR